MAAPFDARAARRFGQTVRPTVASVDLGVDPPLKPTALDGFTNRRRVSLRWLGGIVLIGLSGGVLIGAAIYAALDRDGYFASAPEFAIVSPGDEDQSVNPRKGNRIVQPVDLVAVKRSFWDKVTMPVGQREVVQRREFTRIDTPLAQASLGYADQVPPYNPIRLVAQAGSVQPPADPGQAPDDAEVSFEMRDLSSAGLAPSGPSLSTEEAAAQVAELVHAAEAGAQSPALPPQLLLMRTSRTFSADPSGGLAFPGFQGGVGAPFSSIHVRMVPENVTTVPETTTQPASDEAVVAVRRGETLAEAIARAGVPPDQYEGLAAAFGFSDGHAPFVEGERLKLQFLPAAAGAPRRLGRVTIYADERLVASVALDDAGRWRPVREAPSLSDFKQAADDEGEHGIRLYDSLYQTGLKVALPRKQIEELIRIFASDVDLQEPVAAGDSVDVLLRDGSQAGHPGVIVYASLVAHGQVLKYYRFREPGSNRVDFFDPDGKLREKFLVREPILGARLTSPFGYRFHPILGYSRMHTGVDWAAPIGTPVYAAGAGVIRKAGRESGYGNRIEIQHANGYVTTYNHLSGFARGIVEGAHVAQGQVIAYLGMTGLATGPHLHYEVIVNGHFVDPLRVKLTHTRELSGHELALFQQDRKRIEGLLAVSAQPARVAISAQ